MAASSPRKAVARKAPPKAAAQRSQQARSERVDRFEELRARATGIEDIELPDEEFEDLVLDEEYGFDPPLVVKWPTDLATQLLIDEASRADDPLATLRIVIGRQQFYNVVRVFEAATETKREAIEALVGLTRMIHDHFVGGGASEVGGTPAS